MAEIQREKWLIIYEEIVYRRKINSIKKLAEKYRCYILRLNTILKADLWEQSE
jgi:hypothetical protein